MSAPEALARLGQLAKQSGAKAAAALRHVLKTEDRLRTLLGVLGLLLLAAGLWMVYPASSLIVTGLILLRIASAG